jgi:hypothetical protein
MTRFRKGTGAGNSDEWVAGLITILFIVALVAWVPFLIGVRHCLRRLEQTSDRQAARYPWAQEVSASAETRKV